MTTTYEIKLRSVRVTKAAEPLCRDQADTDLLAEIVRGAIAEQGLGEKESFWAIGLNARGQPTALEMVAVGTLTACLVHPREVFAPMLRAGGVVMLVVAHNHPSGDCVASSEDIDLTARLRAAGDVLGIPVVDSLVVTTKSYSSIG
jgi:DNA repair protein RadC